MNKTLSIVILILSTILIVSIFLTVYLLENDFFEDINDEEMPIEEVIVFDDQDDYILPKLNEIIIETYEVETPDDSFITLTRYFGYKKPPVIFIHGMGTNHKIFDWDKNRVINIINGDPWHMAATPGLLDKLLYQLKIMRDLSNGVKNLHYRVADGGKIKDFQLQILGQEVVNAIAVDGWREKSSKKSSRSERARAA